MSSPKQSSRLGPGLGLWDNTPSHLCKDHSASPGTIPAGRAPPQSRPHPHLLSPEETRTGRFLRTTVLGAQGLAGSMLLSPEGTSHSCATATAFRNVNRAISRRCRIT